MVVVDNFFIFYLKRLWTLLFDKCIPLNSQFGILYNLFEL